MNTIRLLFFTQFALAQLAQAQSPSPSEVFDRFVMAHKTLKFFEVAPYVHPGALAEYRKTTWAVVGHAVEKYGGGAVRDFFQGATSDELQAMSDQDYWAFVMASAQQFSTENPIANIRPLSQFFEGSKLCLVYPATGSLATAPECGSYPMHFVYEFEQERGVWKIASFESSNFEKTLYWFLDHNYPLKPAVAPK